MRRRRNPPGDAGLRDLERAVAAGDPSAVPALIVARLRAGVISRDQLRWAEVFSRPFHGPVNAKADDEDWHPVSTWMEWAERDTDWHGEDGVGARRGLAAFVANAHRFAQDPGTGALRAAIGAAWPKGLRRRSPAGYRAIDRFAVDHGFIIAETDSATHPPYEFDVWEGVDHDSPSRAERRYILAAWRTRQAYEHARSAEGGPEGEPYGSMWLVRTLALRGDNDALAVLGYLRTKSVLEYIETLSPLSMAPLYWAFADRQWVPPPDVPYVPFGQRELELVRSLLGGPPL